MCEPPFTPAIRPERLQRAFWEIGPGKSRSRHLEWKLQNRRFSCGRGPGATDIAAYRSCRSAGSLVVRANFANGPTGHWGDDEHLPSAARSDGTPRKTGLCHNRRSQLFAGEAGAVSAGPCSGRISDKLDVL